MKKNISRLFGMTVGAMVALTTGTAVAAGTITIYTDNYAGDEAMSRVARDVIEQNYDVNVDLKAVSVGVAFLGTAKNENALFLAAWLPHTHKAYMKRVKGKVDDLGTMYHGAKIGWAVPDYVPKDQLNSIPDLKKPEVAAKIHGKIQGIAPGAGEMKVSRKALKIYGLNDIRITNASGAAMTAELKRAIDKHKWIVVTAWSPHWLWSRFDVRYLNDPKGALGNGDHVDVIANPSLKKNYPGVAELLSRMKYKSVAQINGMLNYANKTSYDEAAKRFIKKHPSQIAAWLGNDS